MVMKGSSPVATLVVLLLAGVGHAHAQTAAEIVAATDSVRNPHQPFRSTIRFTEYYPVASGTTTR